jgi:hypothetical protein
MWGVSVIGQALSQKPGRGGGPLDYDLIFDDRTTGSFFSLPNRN